jgi:hypothetical protein
MINPNQRLIDLGRKVLELNKIEEGAEKSLENIKNIQETMSNRLIKIQNQIKGLEHK